MAMTTFPVDTSESSIDTGTLVTLQDFTAAVERAAHVSRTRGNCPVAVTFSLVELERLAILLKAVR